MSLFNGSMSPADLAAVVGNGNDGGFNGNNGWWIILFILLCNNGWGNGFGNGNGSGEVQRSFDTAAIQGQLSAIQAGQSSAEVAACGRSTDALIASYQNQIASMNQNFANSQAIDSRLDNIVLNQQNCCCENKQLIADLKYTIATEGAATRENCNANKQAILDKLCQLEIDNLKEANSNLRSQLNEANRLASQTAQTATFLASQAEQTQQIENYVRPQINPAYIVPNPYANNYNYGYNGCGCTGF